MVIDRRLNGRISTQIFRSFKDSLRREDMSSFYSHKTIRRKYIVFLVNVLSRYKSQANVDAVRLLRVNEIDRI
jgi:hypothetical protein